MEKWKKVFPYIGRQWKLVVLLVFLTASYTATAALQPWPLKLLVDYALGNEKIPEGLVSFAEHFPGQLSAVLILLAAVLSFIIFLLNSGLNSASSWAWTAAGQGMVFDLAGDLFARLQRLSLSFHNRNHVGDLLNRLMGDAYCIYSITDALIVSPAYNLLTLIVLGSISWSMDPQLTVLSLIAAPVMAWSSRYFGKKMKRRAKQDQQAKSRLSSFVQQTLTAIPVVQAFATEDRNREQFRTLAKDAVALTQKGALLRTTYGMANGIALTVGMAAVLFVGGQRVLSGALSVGSLLVFIAYLRSFQGAFSGLQKAWSDLKTIEASIDRVLEVIDSAEEVPEDVGAPPFPTSRNCTVPSESPKVGQASSPVSVSPVAAPQVSVGSPMEIPSPDAQATVPDPTPNTQHPTPSTQHPTPSTQHPTPSTQHPTPSTQHPTPKTRPQIAVTFNNVTFGYTPETAVLKSVNLKAEPGQVIALIGPTGAGKSTLVSLIPRFYDPWEGSILYNGEDIRRFTIESIRQQVSLLPQEPFILPMTISENIAYGRPDASRKEIEQAAESARAMEFIERLPDGFDTIVGERGSTLSGGQKQRLAIARALLKNAPILILDEPTSALDSGTEQELLMALEVLTCNRTTFVIAHRLSTVEKADVILGISDGEIVERGTHTELLKTDGLYASFYRFQPTSDEDLQEVAR